MKRAVAFVTEGCSGCGGAPVCRIFCPRDALRPVPDPGAYPFRRMEVDPDRCSGCGACLARGPGGARILGCPWDAIRLVPN